MRSACYGHSRRQRVGETNKAKQSNDDSEVIFEICEICGHILTNRMCTQARQKFIKGAKDINGVPEHVSQELWERIEFFSVYGFNKSHAVAYAIGSYYAAWLHTHYETDWLSTILESENNNPKNLSKAISEIKAMGYEVSTHDVNESGLSWAWSENKKAFIPRCTFSE